MATASDFKEKWGFEPPEPPEGYDPEQYLCSYNEGMKAGYDQGYKDGMRDGNEQRFDEYYCEDCGDYH